MNLSALLFIAATVAFVLALFGVSPGVNMTVLGLALTSGGLAVGAAGDTRVG